MSRLSKYVKEKIVKVLVAALVVGTVAGNEGIIAQAANYSNVKDFLGKAYNYGIVADTFDQQADAQTNFAVKHYSNGHYVGDDISGVPGFILVGDAQNAENTVKLKSNAQGTQVYYENFGTKVINDYVDEMRNAVIQKSNEAWNCESTAVYENKSMNDQNITMPDSSAGIYYLNVTTEMWKTMNQQQGIIKICIADGQTLVMNIAGDDINIYRFSINGASTASSKGLADKVIFNMQEATKVSISETAGAVIAPKAEVYVNSTCSGWVVARTVVNGGGELHKDAPSEEPTPTPVVPEEPTPTPVVPEEPTPTPVVPEEPTPVVPEEPTPTPVVPEEPTPTPVVPEEPTPTPVVPENPTPTPVVPEDPTPTPVVSEEPTPTPVVTEEPTPTPDTSEPTPTPDDPDTPVTPVTPETPQVLGARRRRMVTIEDDPTPLADKAVLGASRRPQTGDASDAWNLGFALSLTGLGAWLVIRRKEH